MAVSCVAIIAATPDDDQSGSLHPWVFSWVCRKEGVVLSQPACGVWWGLSVSCVFALLLGCVMFRLGSCKLWRICSWNAIPSGRVCLVLFI